MLLGISRRMTLLSVFIFEVTCKNVKKVTCSVTNPLGQNRGFSNVRPPRTCIIHKHHYLLLFEVMSPYPFFPTLQFSFSL